METENTIAASASLRSARRGDARPGILHQIAGNWFLSEARVKGIATRAAAAIASGMLPDDGEASDLEYSKAGGIATIPIIGVLTKYPSWYDDYCGFVPTTDLMAQLKNAMEDDGVVAISLLIDCPGGQVNGTVEFADAIAQANRIKPVTAIVSGMCGSGGYYIASQCSKIVANSAADVGCIGVYCVLADDSQFWADMGVDFTVVSSGGVKGLGADGKVNQTLIDDVKRGVDDIYKLFVAAVAAGRGMDPATALSLADGRSYIASQALQLGLIDQVASVDDARSSILADVPTLRTRKQNMDRKDFDAYAAAHPEAIQAFIDKGRTEATAEANKPATVNELRAAYPDPADSGFIVDQIGANATLAQAAIAYVPALTAKVTKATADAKAATDRATAAEAKLADETKGQAPIRLAGGKSAPDKVDNPDFATIADPTARAKAEWKANDGGCQEQFIDEDSFVGFRAAELGGKVKMARRS